MVGGARNTRSYARLGNRVLGEEEHAARLAAMRAEPAPGVYKSLLDENKWRYLSNQNLREKYEARRVPIKGRPASVDALVGGTKSHSSQTRTRDPSQGVLKNASHGKQAPLPPSATRTKGAIAAAYTRPGPRPTSTTPASKSRSALRRGGATSATNFREMVFIHGQRGLRQERELERARAAADAKMLRAIEAIHTRQVDFGEGPPRARGAKITWLEGTDLRKRNALHANDLRIASSSMTKSLAALRRSASAVPYKSRVHVGRPRATEEAQRAPVDTTDILRQLDEDPRGGQAVEQVSPDDTCGAGETPWEATLGSTAWIVDESPMKAARAGELCVREDEPSEGVPTHLAPAAVTRLEGSPAGCAPSHEMSRHQGAPDTSTTLEARSTALSPPIGPPAKDPSPVVPPTQKIPTPRKMAEMDVLAIPEGPVEATDFEDTPRDDPGKLPGITPRGVRPPSSSASPCSAVTSRAGATSIGVLPVGSSGEEIVHGANTDEAALAATPKEGSLEELAQGGTGARVPSPTHTMPRADVLLHTSTRTLREETSDGPTGPPAEPPVDAPSSTSGAPPLTSPTITPTNELHAFPTADRARKLEVEASLDALDVGPVERPLDHQTGVDLNIAPPILDLAIQTPVAVDTTLGATVRHVPGGQVVAFHTPRANQDQADLEL